MQASTLPPLELEELSLGIVMMIVLSCRARIRDKLGVKISSLRPCYCFMDNILGPRGRASNNARYSVQVLQSRPPPFLLDTSKPSSARALILFSSDGASTEATPWRCQSRAGSRLERVGLVWRDALSCQWPPNWGDPFHLISGPIKRLWQACENVFRPCYTQEEQGSNGVRQGDPPLRCRSRNTFA